jgi:hypothetical protein
MPLFPVVFFASFACLALPLLPNMTSMPCRSAAPKAATSSPHSISHTPVMECGDEVAAFPKRGARPPHLSSAHLFNSNVFFSLFFWKNRHVRDVYMMKAEQNEGRT